MATDRRRHPTAGGWSRRDGRHRCPKTNRHLHASRANVPWFAGGRGAFSPPRPCGTSTLADVSSPRAGAEHFRAVLFNSIGVPVALMACAAGAIAFLGERLPAAVPYLVPILGAGALASVLVGRERAWLLATHFSQLCAEESAASLRLARALKAPCVPVELRLLGSDGTARDVELTVAREIDRGRHLLVLRDLSK